MSQLLAEWLPESAWLGLQALKEIKAFEKLPDDMDSSPEMWKRWYDLEKPELVDMPKEYKTMDEWKKIMTLGLERKRGKTDLGVYGVGLKLSSLSQAHEVTVASVNNGDFGLRRLSANYIRSTGRNEVQKFPIPESQTYRDARQRMIDEEWSTMVLLEDMHAEDRIISLDSTKEASFNKEITKIKIH